MYFKFAYRFNNFQLLFNWKVNYIWTSEYALHSDLNQQPLRIYTEPDVGWWLKERNADLTNMNATECSAMINELNRHGNQNADLITTQKKGTENLTT